MSGTWSTGDRCQIDPDVFTDSRLGPLTQIDNCQVIAQLDRSRVKVRTGLGVEIIVPTSWLLPAGEVAA